MTYNVFGGTLSLTQSINQLWFVCVNVHWHSWAFCCRDAPIVVISLWDVSLLKG